MKLFDLFVSLFDGFSVAMTKNEEYKYYSQATSHEDLERRQRQVQRGEAPFQKYGY